MGLTEAARERREDKTHGHTRTVGIKCTGLSNGEGPACWKLVFILHSHEVSAYSVQLSHGGFTDTGESKRQV